MIFEIKREKELSYIEYEYNEVAGAPVTLEKIYEKVKDCFEYKKVAAKVDNILRPMSWEICEVCRIE